MYFVVNKNPDFKPATLLGTHRPHPYILPTTFWQVTFELVVLVVLHAPVQNDSSMASGTTKPWRKANTWIFLWEVLGKVLASIRVLASVLPYSPDSHPFE